MYIQDLINIEPFSLDKFQKRKLLTDILNNLTKHHFQNSSFYTKILKGLNFNPNSISEIEDLPFLPVRLFKDFELLSVDKSEIIKTMTSSGTTGQTVSKIYLDRQTASNQTKVLTKIVSSFLGNKRLPMLVIDSESVLKNRNMFSARGAGILGFSMFGTRITYALDENMEIDTDKVLNFIEKHKDDQIFIFGFTFMIWKHFLNKAISNKINLDFSKATIIHGGGWKKLINEAVSTELFKEKLKSVFGISKVYDYYGMVEQTGSIFVECEHNYLHAPIFSDIIIRSPVDFKVSDFNEVGIIQLISVLPSSYPGHSILTEDEGYIIGEDDCKCGRKGKYFKIIGRIKNAEIRGCSDTYAEKFN
jgi:phenylacetate-coenzyme A ligase PaaK-like adenylate-forming protein